MATVDQTNYRGIVTYLDADCNTRAGKDHSKLYMENLAYHQQQGTAKEKLCYKFQGLSSDSAWEGNFLKVNNANFYPPLYYNSFAIEMVFKCPNVAATVNNSLHLYDSIRPLGTLGNYCRLTIYKGILMFNTWYVHNNMLRNKELDYKPSDNVPYHIVGQTTSRKKAELYVNGKLVSSEELNTGTDGYVYDLYFDTPDDLLVGVNALGYSESSAPPNATNYPYGFHLGMLKVYNYTLNSDEISTGYQDAKKRFGVA